MSVVGWCVNRVYSDFTVFPLSHFLRGIARYCFVLTVESAFIFTFLFLRLGTWKGETQQPSEAL